MSKHVKAWHDKHDKHDKQGMSKHVKKRKWKKREPLKREHARNTFFINLKNVGHHLSKKRKNANNEKYECV